MHRWLKGDQRQPHCLWGTCLLCEVSPVGRAYKTHSWFVFVRVLHLRSERRRRQRLIPQLRLEILQTSWAESRMDHANTPENILGWLWKLNVLSHRVIGQLYDQGFISTCLSRQLLLTPMIFNSGVCEKNFKIFWLQKEHSKFVWDYNATIMLLWGLWRHYCCYCLAY